MKNVEINCAGSVQLLVKTCSNANLGPAPLFHATYANVPIISADWPTCLSSALRWPTFFVNDSAHLLLPTFTC